MIIEYRTGMTGIGALPSRVLRTYKDVTKVHQSGRITYLYGTELWRDPNPVTTKHPFDYSYGQPFLIAAINLAPGEYLEVVDVPRD
jgi:hypothetical protein